MAASVNLNSLSRSDLTRDLCGIDGPGKSMVAKLDLSALTRLFMIQYTTERTVKTRCDECRKYAQIYNQLTSQRSVQNTVITRCRIESDKK